jgi:UDP-N-acetylglucosamine 2-epimerase
MQRFKVMTVVGTRPEIIRLSRVMECLDRNVNHVIVHTGQNYDYELSEVFFEDLDIRRPDYFLNTAKGTVANTIGNIIIGIDPVLAREKPDAMLILGDTNSCLSIIPAKRRKIPIFHMEAGNRCFDQRVPEEINRKIVDHLSDINMTYTEHARRYLIAEGIRPETIFKTGSPMKEVLDHYMPKIEKSDVLKRLDLKKGNYFVLSSHREENIEIEENFSDLLNSIKAIAKKYKKKIIVSTHPRVRKKIKKMGRNYFDKNILFSKPLGLLDYVKLEINAACVISDSGTITEESSIMNFPAVTIRQAHERPEGMDEGVLIMCGLKPTKVIQSIDIVMSQHSNGKRQSKLVQDYDAENVSGKVLRIIVGYTDYINRTVWNK